MTTRVRLPRFLRSLLLSAAVIAHASIPDASTGGGNEDLAALVGAVIQTGRDTVVRENIARVFGIGAADIAVKERGFRPAGDAFTHVIAVANSNQSLVFIATINEYTGASTIWRTSSSGELAATAEVADDLRVKLINNNEQLASFTREKRYLRTTLMRSPRGPVD